MMFEQLTIDIITTWSRFMEFTKSNPVIAGVFSLWGLSVGTFLLRQIPTTIKNIIERQFTVQLYLHSRDAIFYYCDVWCNKQKFTNNLRSLRALNGRWGDTDEETNITAGYGTHWFFYKWRLIKYERIQEESSATSHNKEKIIFTTFGRRQDILRDLLLTVENDYQTDNVLKIFEWNSDHWRFGGEMPMRPWDTIVTNDGIKEEMKRKIDNFLKPEEQKWKLDNGIHNKITIQLEGPPGTGKTSLVRAMASILKRNICIINLSDVTDKTLKLALIDLKENSIILIEDIDSNGAIRKRQSSNELISKNTNNVCSDGDAWSMLTIQGILNSLDGINSSDGRILFTTTNHPENIDPAILRKGRINYRFYIGPLNKKSICSYLERFFPNTHIKLQEYEYIENLTAASLEGYVLDYRDDIEKILSKIIKDSEKCIK
ncbi:MAG: AAA family ATPase [Candidatus Peribacteraceae bacterium]|nr:AAA family ATPase [Candidatus Peribacteraceae bacterium]